MVVITPFLAEFIGIPKEKQNHLSSVAFTYA